MQPFVEISPPVPENIFEGVLTFMGMVVILVMRPELFFQTLVPPSYRCFISNLALIGKVVSEKDIFENYGNIHVRGTVRKFPDCSCCVICFQRRKSKLCALVGKHFSTQQYIY